MAEVLHVVLFKWKPEATAEQVAQTRAALLSLKDSVPGILEIHCAENFSDRSKGYQTVLIVRFESREALAAYLPHPAHRAVVEQFIVPIRDDSLVVDIDLTYERASSEVAL